MSNWFRRLMRCSSKESMAAALMDEQDRKHDEAMDEISNQVKQAQRAAAQTRSAARTLLKRLSEDIPK